MKQRVIFVRHGSLPERAAGRIIGQCDIELSQQGRQEAVAVGRFLKDITVDKVWAGTLRRVCETHELACRNAANLPEPIFDDRFNEMDFGDWAFSTIAEHPISSWRIHDPEATYPGGENMGDFMRRTRAGLQEVLDSGAETAVIFSHGGVIMGLLADIVGLSREHQFNLWVERGCVAEVAYDNSGTGRLHQIIRPLDIYGE